MGAERRKTIYQHRWTSEQVVRKRKGASVEMVLIPTSMNANLENALSIILDFVERHNKQDKEKEVAEAAMTVQDYLIFND
ncbi:MAG: hypothetical protein DDT19_01138 [Syntrophomonadaceae bacterium]|nr:hypothetical protein [Bacillota bacterium]